MFTGLILSLSRNSIVYDVVVATALISIAALIVKSFLAWKMVFYVRKHPDKAKEIERYWSIDYKGTKLLDKECDITDPTFSRLRKNIKRATMLFYLAVLLTLMLILLTALLAFVTYLFRR